MAFALGPAACAAGVGLKVFDETGSTNIDAMEHARAGGAAPFWFVTAMQTAGRGRRNRSWIAPNGNLACSVLEIRDVTPSIAATLGFAAGLAMEKALRQVSAQAAAGTSLSPSEYRLKWPNDILVDGRKLVGLNVGAETRPDGRLAIVVGMGANVVAAPEGTPYPVGCLHALGVHVSAEDVFAALSDAWHEFSAIWDDGRGFQEIRTLWLARAMGLGERVSVVRGSGKPLDGIFETLDYQGCLIVRTADSKRVTVSAGDVYFGTAASAGSSS